MTLRWPLALFGLVVGPLLLAAYLLQLRRKRRSAVVFSSLALVRAAMPKRASWKRHLPAALFLLGLTLLGVASARPQASAKIAVSRTSIVLALDVSRSMCSTDVAPNRLTVAQEAARSFVEKQPEGTRIGIVEFAGFAMVLVEPTTDRKELLAAIDGLTTARGTVIGSAILRSIDVISSVNPQVPPVDSSIESGAGDSFAGFDPATGETIDSAPVVPAVPAPKEGYVSDIVVVLTDGTNTRGIAPIDAAKEAADRRVRVFTIGFGTSNPTDMVCSAAQLGGDALFDQPTFGAGGYGTPSARAIRQLLVADEGTLQSVANLTGGKFYRAQDADQLRGVFNKLPKDVQLQNRQVELSVAFLGVGALLSLLAMVLSLRWNRTP